MKKEMARLLKAGLSRTDAAKRAVGFNAREGLTLHHVRYNDGGKDRSVLYRASLNKWWFDDLYHLLFIVIAGRLAAAIWWFDREVVDGSVNAVGGGTIEAGRELRRIQTGRVQNYALGIAIGLIVMAGSYLLLIGR